MKNERKCIACGQIHNGGMCPLIQKKMGKYAYSSKQNFVMGNILLECMRKKVDFYQILREIAEAIIELNEFNVNIFGVEEVIIIDFVTEYFAAALNCKSSLFYSTVYNTSKAFSEILELEYSDDISLRFDDEKNVDSIEMAVKIPQYTEVKTVADLGIFCHEYEYQIVKNFLENDSYEYSLKISLPMPITYESKKNRSNTSSIRTIWWSSLNESSSWDLTLLKESKGAIADFFEKQMDRSWTEDDLVLEFSYNDSTIEHWLFELERGIVDKAINCNKMKNGYYGTYLNIEFEIKCSDEGYFLYVRKGKNVGSCFKNMNELTKQGEVNKSRIERLVKNLEKCVVVKSDKHVKSNIIVPKPINLKIGIKDFVVRQAVFKCTHTGHTIQNIDAVLNIVDFEGKKKEIKIPAGYCPQCKIYFIMESTYQNLKKQGNILCRVSDEKTYVKAGYLNNAKLAQESILMQYGYSVSQIDGVTEKQRRIILVNLIDNNILSKSEIISYLDFFINQRAGRSNMELAISKWKADREFVEQYRIGEYTRYGVNAIHRR